MDDGIVEAVDSEELETERVLDNVEVQSPP